MILLSSWDEWGAVHLQGCLFPGKPEGMLKLIRFDTDVAGQDTVRECFTFYAVHCL